MLVVPTFHPAYLLRGAEGEQATAKFERTCIGDLARGFELRHRKVNWDESVIWERDGERLRNLFPTLQEVWDFCRTSAGCLVACDVETTGEQPLDSQLLCIGMANDKGRAICIPVLGQGGKAYWDTATDALAKLWELLRWFFNGGNGARFVFHNGAFDAVVLWSKGLNVFGAWQEDTMQAHHVWDGEMPHGLAFLGSIFEELGYWKDDVKGDVKWLDLPDETLRSYNLRDCLVTIRVWPKLLKGLAQVPGLWECYREEISLAKEMACATIRGIWVDEQRRTHLAANLTKQEGESLSVLRGIVRNNDFNPGSPLQLQNALFNTLGFPVVKSTEKGNPSTDKEAMILLSLIAERVEQKGFLLHLVKWRKSSKMMSTWTGRLVLDGQGKVALDAHGWPIHEGGLPILADGRVHPSWKALPVTGRLSSSPNAQNWNNYIKRIFGAPPGRKLVGSDLNQAELRAMAYYARDGDLLTMYLEGLNVHTINTTLLFRVRNPGLDTNEATEAYLSEACPRLLGVAYSELPEAPKSKWKSMRTLAKNFVFGANYGAIPETLYEVIRSKRDPDTDEPLFPKIELREIEAAKVAWEKLHPAIPKWWRSNVTAIERQGYYQCPVSGRVRWFRGGFKRNEMLNFPIQTLIGSWMNKCTLRIAERLRGLGTTPDPSEWIGITAQVHDMLGVEAPDADAEDVKRTIAEEESKTFPLPGFPEAVLPPDPVKIGRYLHEV